MAEKGKEDGKKANIYDKLQSLLDHILKLSIKFLN